MLVIKDNSTWRIISPSFSISGRWSRSFLNVDEYTLNNYRFPLREFCLGVVMVSPPKVSDPAIFQGSVDSPGFSRRGTHAVGQIEMLCIECAQ